MFEQFLIDLLNTTLGDYVSNLQTNQLNVGIWAGDVVLRDLKLKREALDKLDLPVQVVEGFLGELTLTIPWSNLKGQPVRVNINDVFLLATSKSDLHYDEAYELEKQFRLKMQRLDTAELLHKQKMAVTQGNPADQAKQSGLLDSLVTKIVDNLQITVNNVHIRFEDSKSQNDGRLLALGFTFSRVIAVSTNDEWVEQFIQESRSDIHKLAKLDHLSIYWNVDAKTIRHESARDTVAAFKEQIPSDTVPAGFSFLLRPICGTAKVVLRKSQTHDSPRITVDLLFDDFSLGIDDLQYYSVHYLIQYFGLLVRAERYKKYHPAIGVRPTKDPRAFWRFAIQSVIEPIKSKRRKWSWEFMHKRMLRRLAYIKLWKKNRLATMTDAEKKELQELERVLDYEDLRFFRSIADVQIRSEAPAKVQSPTTAAPAANTGWFGGWFGGGAQSPEKTPVLNDRQLKNLYDTIEYDETEVYQDLEMADTDEKMKIRFELGGGRFALSKSGAGMDAPLFELAYHKVVADVLIRPQSSTYSIALTDLTVSENFTENSLYPVLIRAKDNVKSISSESLADTFQDAIESISSDKFFFHAQYEIKPLDGRADYALKVVMKPLEVVYVRETINGLIEFLKSPVKDVALDAILQAAEDTFNAGVKGATKAGFQFALEEHDTIDIDIDMEAPVIIFPESAFKKDDFVTVFDLGHMLVRSDLVNVRKKEEMMKSIDKVAMSELEKFMYDRFKVSLDNLQVLIGRGAKPTIRTAVDAASNHEIFLLPKTSLTLNLETSIMPSAINFARTKIHGLVPHIIVNFSDMKYYAMLRLLKSFVSNSNTAATPVPEVASPNSTFLEAVQDFAIDHDTSLEGTETPLAPSSPVKSNGDKHDPVKEMIRRLVLIDFKIESLHVRVAKTETMPDTCPIGPIADLILSETVLSATVRPYDMTSDFKIGKLTLLDAVQKHGDDFSHMFTSLDSEETGLVKVHYVTVNKESPHYAKVDQSVEVAVGNGRIQLNLPSFLSIYAFIMSIISDTAGPSYVVSPSAVDKPEIQPAPTDPLSLTFGFTLKTLELILNNEATNLAKCRLMGMKLAIDMNPDSTMKVALSAGQVAIQDLVRRIDNQIHTQFIAMGDGDRFFDLTYDTFKSDATDTQGFDSRVYVRAGSIRMIFMEKFMCELWTFVNQIVATQQLIAAASNSAANVRPSESRMILDVEVQSPIVVVPPSLDSDVFIEANLGSISLKNSFKSSGSNKWNAMLMDVQRIGLLSHIKIGDKVIARPLLADINVQLIMKLATSSDKHAIPDSDIVINSSDISLNITPRQYLLALNCYNVIMTSVFVNGDGAKVSDAVDETPLKLESSDAPPVTASEPWTSMKVKFALKKVGCQIYETTEKPLSNLQVNNIAVDYESKSNSTSTVIASIGNIELTDTRLIDIQYRNMIPKYQGEQNQYLIEYSIDMYRNAMLLVQAKSPMVQVVPDHAFKMRDFFMDGYYKSAMYSSQKTTLQVEPKSDSSTRTMASSEMREVEGKFSYRVTVDDAKFLVISDSAKSNADAMVLSLKQLVLAQENILSLAVNQLGFFLCEANNPTDTSVRIIQNFDLTFFIDSRNAGTVERSSQIHIDIPEAIVLRISYHDVIILMDIVSRFSENSSGKKNMASNATQSALDTAATFVQNVNENKEDIDALEQFEFNCEGFKFILIDDISDMHLPMFHGALAPFQVKLNDWSKEMLFRGSLQLDLNYFNVKNSHWEPLLEPWDLDYELTRPLGGRDMSLKFLSEKPLNITCSHTFLDTFFMIQSKWKDATSTNKKIGDDPYIIKNQTGMAVTVWGENNEGSKLTEIPDGAEIPWRFEDWRKTREEINVRTHKICVQLIGSWETVRGVPTDQVGERVFTLRPAQDGVVDKLACEVRLRNNVKVIILRSLNVIKNCTRMDIEAAIFDTSGKIVSSVIQIPAGEDYGVPLKHVYNGFIKFRPESSFGYEWSQESVRWRDLISTDRKMMSLTSKSEEAGSDFRCHVHGAPVERDTGSTQYPHGTISLFPPFQLENCLPMSFRYTILDRNSKRQFRGKLESAEIEPLHSVSLQHVVGLVIDVEGSGFAASNVALVNTIAGDSVDTVMTLKHFSGSELVVSIHIRDFDGDTGAKHISIYAPYLLINKSGLDFQIQKHSMISFQRQTSVDVKALETDANSVISEKAMPTMFSISNTGESSSGKVVIKTSDTDWSKPFGLNVVGAIIEVQMNKTVDDGLSTVLGCSIATGTGVFSRTKVITMTPRFVIHNNIDEEIYCRVFKSNDTITVPAGASMPLYNINHAEQLLMAMKMKTVFDEWSSPFNFNELGKIFFKLVKVSKVAEILIRVDVIMEDATIYILVSQDKSWPYRIDNSSSADVIVYQLNARARYKIKQQQSMLYTWDEPALREKLLIVNVDGYERELRLQELGPLMPLTYTSHGKQGALAMELIAEGPTFVLRFEDYKKDQSVFVANSSSPTKEKKSPDDEFKMIDVSAEVFMTIEISISSIALSLVNRNRKEILLGTIQGFNITYRDTNIHQTLGFTVKNVQIDNQSLQSLDPVILCPTTYVMDSKPHEIKPILQAALVRSKNHHYGVDFYRYFTLLMQEISIELDEDFLISLIEFFHYTGDEAKDELWNRSLHSGIPNMISDQGRMYFEIFQIQPVKFNISFSLSDTQSFTNGGNNRFNSYNPLVYLTNVLTMTIGNITDAPIRLNSLIVEHPTFTAPLLMDLVYKHYTQEVLRQVHKIIGSADFLGNPVGLFNTLGSGVKDVFYEPYLGFVSDRPQDFGIGIAKGAASFLRKTVFGVSDTFSKFTGSVGKGLASATLDVEFQAKRKRSRNRIRPKHAGEGVTNGASSFAKSLMSGVTGIVEQPMRGAEKEGFGGFMKGLGRGIVGVVTKPVVGVFDLASNVTEGIKNTTTMFSDDILARARLPRHIGRDGVIKPFDQREAAGALLLSQLQDARYLYDSYVAHLDIRRTPETAEIVMVTDVRVMGLRPSNLHCEWMVPCGDIKQVLQERETSVTLLLRGNRANCVIPCPSPANAQWLKDQIQEAVHFYEIERGGANYTA